MPSRKLQSLLYPELRQLETDWERSLALGGAWKQLYKHPVFWVGAALLISLTILPFVLRETYYELSRSQNLVVALVFSPVGQSFGLLWTWYLATCWLGRRTIRRSLRRSLNERGQAICVPCGYDLTGNTSGRCPECGASIQRRGAAA
ncbi:MAG TPA: hypothetical protein VGM03_00560 [Phycisphaerae bacterium]|jgi:hypothetical protein